MWVELAPLTVTIIGFADRLSIITSCIPTCRASSQRRRGMLYLFLYNKWYFDELYDFLFVRPAAEAGPLPVEDAATAR